MKLSKLVINKTRESQSLMVFEQRSYTQQLWTYTFQLVMKHYVFSLPKQHCPFRHLELKPLNAVIVKVHTLYKELTNPPQSRITRNGHTPRLSRGRGISGMVENLNGPSSLCSHQNIFSPKTGIRQKKPGVFYMPPVAGIKVSAGQLRRRLLFFPASTIAQGALEIE